MDRNNAWEFETQYQQILSQLKLDDLSIKVGTLSGGQKKRLALIKLIVDEPDVLLLDEPTNHLDAESVHWLEQYLQNFPGTVIAVTHDRYFLDMVCTHIVDIDFGGIRIYTGNYTFWYESSQLMAQQISNKNKKVEQKRLPKETGRRKAKAIPSETKKNRGRSERRRTANQAKTTRQTKTAGARGQRTERRLRRGRRRRRGGTRAPNGFRGST